MVSDELEVLKIVVQRLEKTQIKYLITGSIAANFYSQPRMTRDIDIVVELPRIKIDEVYDLFKDDFYIDKISMLRAINETRMFNIIHNEKVLKVDIIISQATEYEQVKFKRRVIKDIEGLHLALISVEDLILSKLLWAKDTQSQLQFDDVRNLLSFNRDLLDFDYLQNWAERLSVKNLMGECLNG